MANSQDTLSPPLIAIIREQAVFFVASAAGDSRVNCSPKGMDTFRVLNDRTVAYLDVTGSGNETSAHIVNGGRVTIMFCGFGEKAMILRLYGRGEVVRPGSAKWNDVISQFNQMPGQRQIIALHIESLQTSCGFGVPRMQLIAHRDELPQWARKKSEQGMAEYRAKKNVRSIDGLDTGIASDSSSIS